MRRHFILKLDPHKALVIGLIFLLLASVLLWSSAKTGISVAAQKQCERQVRSQSSPPMPEHLALCASSLGWVAQQNAIASGGDAQEVARAISQANQNDLSFHAAIMFFAGLFLIVGVVMTAKGAAGFIRKKR